jgi:hypothetical protein
LHTVRLASLITGIAAIVAALVLPLGPGHPDGAGAKDPVTAGDDMELAIDADADNGDGPCDPIDEEAYVEEGATHRVAVCILNPPEAPYSFLTRVLYDSQINEALEMPDVLPALDDNPDANAGETTFSSPDLGVGWDCSGMGIYPPRGDDEYTPEKSDAVLACHTDLRNPSTTLDEGGPLEVITFEVTGRGDDYIEFDPQTQIGGVAGAIGRCGEVPSDIVPCHGAVIHKGQKEGEPPLPTRTPTPEELAEASPGAPTPVGTPAVATPEGATPAAGETAPEADEEGFPWAVLGGALGGAVLVVVLVGGLYAWRRAAGGRT